jgi:hypothetical protein
MDFIIYDLDSHKRTTLNLNKVMVIVKDKKEEIGFTAGKEEAKMEIKYFPPKGTESTANVSLHAIAKFVKENVAKQK